MVLYKILKKNIMKKVIFPFLFILSIGFIGYEHRDIVQELPEIIKEDPAEYVLNSNIPEAEVISIFNSKHYGEIELDAGEEASYGIRHILARHTTQYFINFDDKNNASFFPSDIDGKDLIKMIDYFYDHCISIPAYNRKTDKNIVYLGFSKINDKEFECLLVVNKQKESITTFYPVDDIDKLTIYQVQTQIEEDIDPDFEPEPDIDDYYYYD